MLLSTIGRLGMRKNNLIIRGKIALIRQLHNNSLPQNVLLHKRTTYIYMLSEFKNPLFLLNNAFATTSSTIVGVDYLLDKCSNFNSFVGATRNLVSDPLRFANCIWVHCSWFDCFWSKANFLWLLSLPIFSFFRALSLL